MIETGWDGVPVELRDVDASRLLDLAAESMLMRREADRRVFHLAQQWAVLHPAVADEPADWGDLHGVALDDPVRLGGDGAPEVRGDAIAPFAAALGISTVSGAHWIEDAQDLLHRLPRIWGRYSRLEVDTWKVRLLARLTRPLSARAAAFVDAELVDRIAERGGPTIERAVAEAIARFHPELLEDRARAGKAAWRVIVRHPLSPVDADGRAWLEGCADAQDLTAFDDLLSRIARELGHHGDTDSLDQRRAKALGIIARGEDTGSTEQDSAGAPQGRKSSRRRRGELFVHVGLTDLAVAAGLTTGDRAATARGSGLTVDGYGPVAIDVARRWLLTSDLHVTPVVDLARDGAVDRHDPPPWMRELVLQRDRCCVFPWCAREVRSCELDHIVPYDPNGPPGQTRPDNLAPLCRRHHRHKTFARWRYARTPDGHYLWRDPFDRRYLTTPDGTQELTWVA